MDFKREYLGQWVEPPFSGKKPLRPAPVFMLKEEESFQVYWEIPKGISIEDPALPDPRHERLLRNIGVQRIVDAVEVVASGSQIQVGWYGDVLGEMVPEQRQVVIAHLAHILSDYIGQDSDDVKEYIIKAHFHLHVQRLADLEEEPGEFA